MDFFAQLPTLEVHDSTLKSLTLGFDARYVTMEVDFYQEQTGEYITNRWTFKEVSRISLTNLEALSDDLEIFNLETQVADQNAKRITFQFLQGPGKPIATLDFICKEASSEQGN